MILISVIMAGITSSKYELSSFLMDVGMGAAGGYGRYAGTKAGIDQMNKKWGLKTPQQKLNVDLGKNDLAMHGHSDMDNYLKPSRLKYSDVEKAYNKVSGNTKDAFEKISGKVDYNAKTFPKQFTNSCTCRLSYALNQAGDKIPFIKGETLSDINNDWTIYRVKTLNNYLGERLHSTINYMSPHDYEKFVVA